MSHKDKFTRFIEVYEYPTKTSYLSSLEDRINQSVALSYKEDKKIPKSITISVEEYKQVEDYSQEVDEWKLRTGTPDPFRYHHWETILGIQTDFGFVELRKEKV